MKDSDVQRIQYMKTYCEKIAKTISRFGSEYKTFTSDDDYFNSISMSIMQIGELSAGLSSEFKDSTKNQMSWGMMKGMRNMFAHTYAAMDKEIIWEVAIDDIPSLLLFCDRVIEGAKEKSAQSLTGEKISLLRN